MAAQIHSEEHFCVEYGFNAHSNWPKK